MKELKYFHMLVAMYIATMLTFNVVAVKLWQFGSLVFTAGILLVPITYIFGDVLTEVYGYARTRQVIWLGFACNCLMILAIKVAVSLPPAPGWNLQSEFQMVLESTPRIAFASLMAYLAGEFVNSYVIAKLKLSNRGHTLFFRCFTSTALGQLVDTTVFIILAFSFVMPGVVIVQVIVTALLFKLAYETLAYPITCRIIIFLKASEGLDENERGVLFSPFILKGGI
jgi:queuosine precursor transporter